MQQLDVYFQQFLNMFRASLCPSSGEQDVCYCVGCAALVLLDVVGSGCGALPCGVRNMLRNCWTETCWEIFENKHLTVAFCWFSLSLHNLLTTHGHRNLKQINIIPYFWNKKIKVSFFFNTVRFQCGGNICLIPEALYVYNIDCIIATRTVTSSAGSYFISFSVPFEWQVTEHIVYIITFEALSRAFAVCR